MNQRSSLLRGWYALAQWFLQLASVVVYRLRCTGRENVPPKGPALLVSNHQSHFDPPLLGLACMRQMSYIGRQTLFQIGVLNWFMRSLNAFPIDRDGSGLAGLRETLRRLDYGEIVLMFPEGTRTRDGQVGPFRPGFTLLAARGKASIVPAAIEGAYDVWPSHHSLPRLGTIHICFGDAIPPDELEKYGEEDLVAEVRRRVQRCQAQLRRHPAFARRASSKKGG